MSAFRGAHVQSIDGEIVGVAVGERSLLMIQDSR